jgi:small basic protein
LSALAVRASRLCSPGTALVLGVAVVLLAGAAVPLGIASHDLPQGIIVMPFGVVGYVVARRQPRNPIGWILLAATLAFLLSTDAGTYAALYYRQGYRDLPLARAGAFLAAWWIWLLLLLPLPVGLFPDGRVSGNWRRVVLAYLAIVAIFIAASTWQDATGILARHIRVDSNGELVSSDNGPGGSPAKAALALSFVAFCIACVARQIVGYRRSGGVLRQQRKWLLAGGAFSIGGLILAIAINNSSNPVLHVVGFISFLSVAALPIGIGVGILRYRLYDIDRLISRTLSYALLTGLLVGVFVGLVLLTTRVLPFSSPVGVAAATLAAAALFSPLRNRLQRLVDRRFNRARYDAEAVVAAFGARLRDAIDVDSVLAELSSVAARSLEPATVTVWVRNDPGTAPL